jgi:hypothetical protein
MKAISIDARADGGVDDTLRVAIETLLPVSMRNDGPDAPRANARLIATAAGTCSLPQWIDNHSTLSLALPGTPREAPAWRTARVQFADSIDVPWPYRGRALDLQIPVDTIALAVDGTDTVLAASGNSALWTVSRDVNSRCMRSAVSLPRLERPGALGSELASGRAMSVLPLIEFARAACNDERLLAPALRASFVIDDPNVRWPTYGYADFEAIANDAAQYNYHVAFATIPLDAGWVHPANVRIFSTPVARVSLLVHGNNHARDELAAALSTDGCAALLRQARTRIEVLERRSGLQVCRVMVPPHGACSSQMLAALPAQGFEAACISAGSLRAHNVGQAWTDKLGLAPSETVLGCTVLPRWAFAAADDALLMGATYLGQPLVLRGHHADLKEGLDLFRAFAQKINRLGSVRWSRLSDLSRSNFCSRHDASTLHVRALSPRIEFGVESGIERVVVAAAPHGWRSNSHGVTVAEGQPLVLDVAPGGSVRVEAMLKDLPSSTKPDPRTPAKLILRRVLTEARDRLLLA